jgi:DNA-binding PadR family transcriptional regulator
MKSLTFEILLVLSAGERHGWALARELQARDGGEQILPANFYRTLRAMVADGLIEETGAPRSARTESGNLAARRYFRVTTAGREAARAEARRLEVLVSESRAKRLLPAKAAKGR